MITNQETLDILRKAARDKTPILLSGDGVEIAFQTEILAIEGQHLLIKNRIPPEHISNLVKSRRFILQIQMLRMECLKIHSDGSRIIFPLANLDEIEDNRKSERFFFGQDDVQMEVTNPYDKSTILKKSVIDLSNTGVSIKSPVKSKLYAPGTHFKGMNIIVRGKSYGKADGEVVYSRRFLDIKGKYYYQIGFRFDEAIPGEP